MNALTVTHEFAPYKVGDHIFDPKLIKEISEGHNHAKVVRVNLPDEKPEAKA
jgi:hypothetical protein